MTLREAKAYYRFDDFTGFIEAFKAVTRRLIDPEDYELVAWRMMQQLAAQGIVHAEVYISVGVIYMWRNFDPRAFEPIFEALERARERAARELNLSLYWIFDAVRHFTVEEADRVFRKAAEMRNHYASIIGIGLGGDERRTGSEPFRALYEQARRAGLRLTNHAGETTGPEAIREALSIGSAPASAPLSLTTPCADVSTPACSSPSTPTIPPSSAPTSPVSICSPTSNRTSPAPSCASLLPTPSAPASFPIRIKRSGYPESTQSSS